jgi:hypothetical protein
LYAEKELLLSARKSRNTYIKRSTKVYVGNRFLQLKLLNTYFTAFVEIHKIITPLHRSKLKFSKKKSSSKYVKLEKYFKTVFKKMSLFYIVHRFLFPSRFEAKMGEISEKTLKNHVFRKVSILRWRDFEKFCSKGSCPGSAELPLTSVVQATRYRQPWTRGTTAKKLL